MLNETEIMMQILKPIMTALLICGAAASGNAQIPEDSIYGDFDGDGKKEHLWMETKYDEDEYATEPFVLRSDNLKLDRKFKVEAPRYVLIMNEGKLNGGNVEYFSITPYGDSTWSMTSVYVFSNGNVHKAVDGFTTWSGNEEEEDFVRPADCPGYAVINEYGMDVEDSWTPRRKTVKLK